MGKKINIDMWHKDKFKPKKYSADVYFIECETWHGYCYAGNIYNNAGRTIGDYQANSMQEIEENFNF